MKISRIAAVPALCFMLSIGLIGCGGGSGGGTTKASSSGATNPFVSPSQTSGGSTSSSGSAQSGGGSGGAVGDLGLVLVPNDPTGVSNASGLLQIVHIFDSNGTVLPAPSMSTLTYNQASDFDGAALTPNGDEGVIMDGYNNNLYYFSVSDGTVSGANTINTNYGTDGDSVALLSSGDEAVVTLDNSAYMVLVSGILSGSPQPAEPIFINSAAAPSVYRDGLLVSNDDKVLLARGYDGLTVFSISAITPQAGPWGPTIAHTFTRTADIASLGDNSNDGSGRDGMAISPTDSSRAVIITNGTGAGGSSVSLLTGLPGSPAVSNSVTVDPSVYTVAISPDGNLAVVGTGNGLLMFTGVASGVLTQVGPLYTPSYTLNNTSVKLGLITTLGFTVDGKYVVVCDYSNNSLLVIPVSSSGFGAPAGILGGVSVPWSDTIMVH